MTSLGLASNIFQNHFFPSEKKRIFLGRQKIVFSLVVNKTFDNWCKTWINNKETINIVCYGAIRQTLPTNRILIFFHLKHLNNTHGKQYKKLKSSHQDKMSLFLMCPSSFSLSAAFTGSKTGRKGSENWDPI